MPVDPQRVRAVFLAAAERPAAERPAVLDRECGADAELRRRVEALLTAYDEPGRVPGEPDARGPATRPYTSGADALPPPPPEEVSPPSLPLEAGGADDRPGAVIGPYKLLQRIGEGGMGVVWMAEQEQPVRRRVALKVIKPGMDSRQVVARFEAERQALALMDHPNIAKVLDAGTTASGRPYFVMELVKGVSITKFCDDNKLTPRERLELFVPVCQAVQHAHQKGVIHRDLKPSNVLIALYDGRPVPKVIDFGVAKALHQKLTERTMFTEFGQVVGTLEYMSPEQAELNQLDIDTRSDVYSLGVLLYELLTGTTPLNGQRLRGAALGEMLRLIREEEPPRPSTRLSQSGEALASISAQRRTEPAKLAKLVRGELDWVVMKALEKDRGRRYETASGLARDLQRYLADEPVEAGPPSAAYRLRKLLRRHKGPVLAAVTIALLLLAGITATSWAWVAAVRARDAEAQARGHAEEAEGEARRERDQAVEQKKRADEQTAIARAVGDFLQNDLLRQASGHGQREAKFIPNPKLTVREALERAAARIGDRFQAQPLVEAAIRSTIGNAYIDLSEHRLAVPHLERSVALYEVHKGPDDPATLDARDDLAGAYQYTDQYTESARLSEETLRRSRARGVSRDDGEPFGLVILAYTYINTGCAAKALPLLEESLQARETKLGPTHQHALDARVDLAHALSRAGRPDAAVARYEELFRLWKSLGVAPPPSGWLNGLAMAYTAAGRFDDAVRPYEELAERYKVEDGPDANVTLKIMAALAMAYQGAGRLRDARALLEEVSRRQTAKLGPDHPDTLQTLYWLALTVHAEGRLDEAVALYEKTLARQRAVLRPGNAQALATALQLASAYREQGKLAPAEALATEVLAHHRGQGGRPGNPAGALAVLGAVRLAQGRYAEAEPLLRESLAILGERAPAHWSWYNVLSLLGGSLLGQRKYAEAEPLLRQGYEGLEQRAARIPALQKPRITEARERLVQLYEAWGKPEQAAEWRNRRAAGEAPQPAPAPAKP